MRIFIILAIFVVSRQLASADLGEYLECRVIIAETNGSWEPDTLMVAQIGTCQGRNSAAIDSIVIKKNGDQLLIRDQIKQIANKLTEWEISRRVIKLTDSLDKDELLALTNVASISRLQNKVKEINSSSISNYKRYLHIYTPETKWLMNELVVFPALSENPKECEKWEGKFRSLHRKFPGK